MVRTKREEVVRICGEVERQARVLRWAHVTPTEAQIGEYEDDLLAAHFNKDDPNHTLETSVTGRPLFGLIVKPLTGLNNTKLKTGIVVL